MRRAAPTAFCAGASPAPALSTTQSQEIELEICAQKTSEQYCWKNFCIFVNRTARAPIRARAPIHSHRDFFFLNYQWEKDNLKWSCQYHGHIWPFLGITWHPLDPVWRSIGRQIERAIWLRFGRPDCRGDGKNPHQISCLGRPKQHVPEAIPFLNYSNKLGLGSRV